MVVTDRGVELYRILYFDFGHDYYHCFDYRRRKYRESRRTRNLAHHIFPYSLYWYVKTNSTFITFTFDILIMISLCSHKLAYDSRLLFALQNDERRKQQTHWCCIPGWSTERSPNGH